jgi:predicted lipid-binding transport protein (Tim44 family)
MSYCPKCGIKVDETMAFCPRCGAALRATATSQAPPQYQTRPRNEKNEKREKQEKNQQQPEKREKNEKGEHGFVGYLIGGLVLIIIGLFSVLRISNALTSDASWAVMLLIIGVIIIVAAVYLAFIAKRHNPPPT